MIDVRSAIKTQGELVRKLKAEKSPEASAAIAALLKLKTDLNELTERLKAADIANE